MRPLILASQSPRRAQLLREAGFEFTVEVFDTNEDFSPHMPPEDVAPHLSERKAAAAAHLIKSNEIILAADSVVIVGGRIFNKPADYAEAFYMIRQLAGRQHTVVTGVCLRAAERVETFAGVSHVWFSDFTDDEIDYYIRHYAPYDKAGAYGVQDWIGLCKIHRLEGTYANVMGLPVDLVYEKLKQFG